MKKNNNLICMMATMALVVFVLITGLGGIDFGVHWDESTIIGPIQNSIQLKTLLPHWYYYPSFCHDLGLFSLTGDIVQYWRQGHSALTLQGTLLELTSGLNFLLRMRALTVFFSTLSLVWIYISVFVWSNNPFESFLASAF